MNRTHNCPKCANPLPVDDPQGHCTHCLKPGSSFDHGRYTLFEPLAINRTGVLWRACDEHLDGFVTLRFLAHDLRSDRAVMEGLRLEVERARRLVHPNIARVHELIEATDEPAYVVSEWIKGEPLPVLLQQQPQECFTWPEVEPWLLQLVQALDHAHREGVLHGNLTAADVWLDHEGRIRITGFGFACLSGVATSNSEPAADVPAQTGWSPQQHAGQFAEITDDLYALGALGYELLSGRAPFYLGDVAEQACHVLPQPLEERLADFNLEHRVPNHVAAALLTCLAKERSERPAMVTDFVHQLAFGADGESPAPVPDPEPVAKAAAAPAPEPPAIRAPRPPVRWPRVAVGVGVAMAILLLGLGAVWLRSFKSNTQALVAAAQLAAGEATTTNAHAQSQPAASPVQPGFASRDAAYTNSLGMPFVPVANNQDTVGDRPVRFCRWLTRVQDFEAFVRATGHNATDDVWSFGAEGWKSRGHNWRTPGFEQTGMHPVSGVSWEDAQAFAKWLTDKERTEGRLAPGERYRLPYDWEWSVAAGLAETRDGLPQDRHMRIKDVFPWGTQWPPPAGAGNYGNFIPGFRDGFERSSPVGSFPTNRFGLHDMGGNLWQWCEDWFDAERVNRPLRGGSWSNDPADTLWSSYRHHIPPHRRFTSNGFRVVLAHEPNSSGNAARVEGISPMAGQEKRLSSLALPVTAGLARGLIAEWRADNSSFTYLDGRTFSPIRTIEGVMRKVTIRPGKNGGAFDFAASDAAVVMEEWILKQAFSALTIVAWVKARSHGQADYDGFGRTIISRTEDGGFALRVVNGRIQLDLRTEDGSTHRLLFQHIPLPLNTWVNVCATYDGNVARAYVNGEPAANTHMVRGKIKVTTKPSARLMIGNEPGTVPNDPTGIVQPGNFGWVGLIDQLVVYDRALSHGELSAGLGDAAANVRSTTRTNTARVPVGPLAPGSGLLTFEKETLWNEKSDFTHWRGEAQFWSIEKGLLTGRMTGPGMTYLTWTGSPVDDFELVLVFRTKGDGQANVLYRFVDSPMLPGASIYYSAILNERTIRAYPATERSPMITDYVGRLYSSIRGADGLNGGRSYGPHNDASFKGLRDTLQLNGRSELIPAQVLESTSSAVPAGEGWTELTINAQARRLAHWRNGRLVTAVLDSDFPTAAGPSTLPDAPGGIQLQLHNYLPGRPAPPGMTIEVQFKEIRLTRLPKVSPIRITNAPPSPNRQFTR